MNSLIDEAFNIGMLQQYEEISALVELMRAHAPKNVMEIGSCHGGTFFLWCKLASADGLKISLDLPNGRFGANDYIDSEALAERIALFQSWAENVHVLSGDSHQAETKEQIRRILDGELLDFLFIDGDHEYKGVKLDFDMYREFVRPSGLIGFHDIRNTEHHRLNSCFVHEFWKELPCPKQEIIDPLGYWGGIGVATNA